MGVNGQDKKGEVFFLSSYLGSILRLGREVAVNKRLEKCVFDLRFIIFQNLLQRASSTYRQNNEQ